MSITLTTPASINTVLGGNTPVNYDHVVLSPIDLNPVDGIIRSSIRITSSSDPDMDVISGTLLINASQGSLVFTVPQLDMVRKMSLSAGQIAAVNTIISDAQNALESGLISIGVVAGIQSTGT